MAVVMVVKKGNEKARTCDERCYNAQGRRDLCCCVCGGINHGVGLEKARDNIKRHAEEIFEQYRGCKVKMVLR